MRTRYFAVAVASLTGLWVIGACGTLLVTREAQAPPPLACNGSPNWCIVARSDLDAMHPGYVFIDDRMAGLVLAGRTRRFPITAGPVHQIKFCAYYDVPDAKEWRCSTPIASRLGGNTRLAMAPLEAAPLYGGGPAIRIAPANAGK